MPAPAEQQFMTGFEQTLNQIRLLPEVAAHPAVEGVIDVASLPGDAELVNQAKRNLQIQLVGDMALSETVSVKEKPIKNIREALLWASQGDQEGRNNVDENVRTDAFERLFKAGNIITVPLSIDGVGNIYQHGQRMDDVHRNAYQMASGHHIIKPRTQAEANNGARIKHAYHEGILDDHVMLVFSMCAEGVSDEELDKLNFFSLTKSMAIQATTIGKDGLYMESAFVAGVKDERSERHDRYVVEETGQLFGVDYTNKTVDQIIDRPVYIPKSLMPNGVVDIVKLLDDIKGDTFFGQGLPKQDYVQFKDFCKRRADNLEGDIQAISDQLISELDHLQTAVLASRRLGKLVEEKMVLRAEQDPTIDARIFGRTSARHIETARTLRAEGQYEQAARATQMAILTAKSGSCPSAELDLLVKTLGLDKAESKNESSLDKDEKGSLIFDCPKGHSNRRPYGQTIPCCTTCGISVECKDTSETTAKSLYEEAEDGESEAKAKDKDDSSKKEMMSWGGGRRKNCIGCGERTKKFICGKCEERHSLKSSEGEKGNHHKKTVLSPPEKQRPRGEARKTNRENFLARAAFAKTKAFSGSAV